MGKVCSKDSALVGHIASSRRKSDTTPATTAQNETSQRTPRKPEEGTAPEAAANSGAFKSDGGIDAVNILTVEQRVEPAELVIDAPAREAGGAHEEAAPKEETENLEHQKGGGEKISVTTLNGQQGVAPVAVIRQEKVLMEEGEKGEGVMKVSISEAIISADLPGLPATVEGVSPEDLELLRKAHEHVKGQREQASGPVVVDITDEEAQAGGAIHSQPGDSASGSQNLTIREDVAKAAAYGYLLYSAKKDGGSLIFLWSKVSLDSQAEGAGNDKIILLSFVPAPQKPVPKIKFTAHQGRSVLLTEIETKWEVWKKQDKKKYFAAWTQALKICDDYEATLTLRQWTAPWPPPVRVALLHVGPVRWDAATSGVDKGEATHYLSDGVMVCCDCKEGRMTLKNCGPGGVQFLAGTRNFFVKSNFAHAGVGSLFAQTGTNSVILPPNRQANLNTFNYLAVLPVDAANFFKGGSISTEKKFVDSAAEAGGASLRLSRRGYGAALDQDDLLKWLKEDGIDIPPDQKGITLGGEHVQYERRSVDRQLG